MKRADIEEDQKVVLYSTRFNPEDFQRDLKSSELNFRSYICSLYT